MTMRVVLSALCVGWLGAFGCSEYSASGDEPPTSATPSGSSSGTAPGNGSSSSGAAPGNGSSGEPPACRASCRDDVRVGCDGEEVACADGCVVPPSGEARCAEFDPFGPITPADLAAAATLEPLSLGTQQANAFILLDIDTGRITRSVSPETGSDPPVVTELRAANDLPSALERKSGIGYQRHDDRAVFYASSITIGPNFSLQGSTALTLASGGNLTLEAPLRVPCGLGTTPRTADAVAVDAAAGEDGLSLEDHDVALAAGGGGNGGRGGAGGVLSLIGGLAGYTPRAGGAPRPWDPNKLLGGGHGGIPFLASDRIKNQQNGGGALQLIAAQQLRVKTSSGADALNSNGCVGRTYSLILRDSRPGATRDTLAGGGAGGTLWLEAREIVLDPGTGLSANGASGTHDRHRGRDGATGRGRACAGSSSVWSCGGAGDQPDGADGPMTEELGAGALSGGGGAGRIVLRTARGRLQRAGDVMISPAPTVFTLGLDEPAEAQPSAP